MFTLKEKTMGNGETSQSISIDEAADRIFGLMEPSTEAKAEEAATEKPEEPDEKPATPHEGAGTREPEEDDSEEADPEPNEEAKSDEDEGEGESDAETAETTEITTIAELAEALEKPLEELLSSLKTSIKVDGKTSEVTLAELQAGYSRQQDYTKKTMSLARDREAFETGVRQARDQLNADALAMAQIVQAAEQMIMPQFDPQQMEHLRATNPAEWSARMQELQTKSQFLEQLKTNTRTQLEQYQAQARAQQEAVLGELIEQEREKLAAIPGWGDQMRQEVFDYLTNEYKFTPEYLNITDHRLIDIVRKARAFDKMQSENNLAQKKVKTLPKLVPPGKQTTKVQAKKSALSEAKARLRKSGTRQDAEAVLERILFR